MSRGDIDRNRLLNHVNAKLNGHISNEAKQSQRYEERVPDGEGSVSLSQEDPSLSSLDQQQPPMFVLSNRLPFVLKRNQYGKLIRKSRYTL